jgi:hypothetical protein
MSRLRPWLRYRGPDLFIVGLWIIWAAVDPLTN